VRSAITLSPLRSFVLKIFTGIITPAAAFGKLRDGNAAALSGNSGATLLLFCSAAAKMNGDSFCLRQR
jgi:hypothetical protein